MKLSILKKRSTTGDTEDTEVKSFSREGLHPRVPRVLRGGEFGL